MSVGMCAYHHLKFDFYMFFKLTGFFTVIVSGCHYVITIDGFILTT